MKTANAILLNLPAVHCLIGKYMFAYLLTLLLFEPGEIVSNQEMYIYFR